MGVSIHQLLKYMVDNGGSDLHITVNSPPQVRIHGKLSPIPGTESLSAAETKQLCYSILTDQQKHKFEETLELDLSFGIKGLSRFRGNVFSQRGAVAGAFRTIPYEIRGFKELGLPERRGAHGREAPRAHPRDGPDRLGQVHDAGGHDRQDQPRAAATTSSPSRTRWSTSTPTSPAS